MKSLARKLSLFSILFGFALYSNHSFSQCTPNNAFMNEDLGFYPLTSDNCAGFTFTSKTDSVITVLLGQPVDVMVYLDAFKITDIRNLPNGITISTDVSGSADGSAPWGYWYNSGSVPNQTKVLGCLSLVGNQSTINSLIGTGPYSIEIDIDSRIAGTLPDLTGIINPGSWISSIPVNSGGGVITYQLTLNFQNCNITPPCTPLPNVLFAGLNSSYTLNSGSSTLAGAPSGGTFYGSGISGNVFNPASAGVGTHSVVYVYTDLLGCTNAYGLCTTVNLNVDAGEENHKLDNGIDVYPNPSKGTYSLNIDDQMGIIRYSIFDGLGKELMTKTIFGNGNPIRETIDMQNAPIGVYVMEIETNEGRSFKKLVKN
jgi:hypothetical protein